MKSILIIITTLIWFSYVQGIEVATEIPASVAEILNDSRRILNGWEVTEGRPYMVHLKLPRSNQKHQAYRSWLCGGVIVHEEYIITSAACIEDAEHFYVVSGTYNRSADVPPYRRDIITSTACIEDDAYEDDFYIVSGIYKYNIEDDKYTNLCIKNGAKKAIWKCVPKNYVFDGHENDNIRWMNNDIAVVKVEDGFDFERRVKGCDFIPKPLPYNNQSATLENPGNIATVAGWGTTSKYSDWISRRKEEGRQTLLESRVEIIAKNRCKRRWGSRYNNIIDNYMICTKDVGQFMSEICNEKYVDCQDINYSDEDEGRRAEIVERVPTNLVMHSAHDDRRNNSINQNNQTIQRRAQKAPIADGGFCENDHGGPLIYGEGVNSVVIGIISACLVKERTNKCYGPFLYTSVYKNRQFVSCAIFKDVEPKCRRQFRSGETHTEKVMSWKNHEDGPAANELDDPINNEWKYEPKPPQPPKEPASSDRVYANRGYVLKVDERSNRTA